MNTRVSFAAAPLIFFLAEVLVVLGTDDEIDEESLRPPAKKQKVATPASLIPKLPPISLDELKQVFSFIHS